jgi:MFS family permease
MAETKKGNYLAQFDRRVWTLFVGRIISATGFSIVIPFLSIYFYGLGIPLTTIGLVFLVSTLTGAMGQVVGGEIADRFGRRKIMIFAMGSRAVVFLLISLAIASGYGFLTIAALIVGSSFFGSLFEPASNAMIADIVEPSQRLEAYGLLRIGQNVGWTLGPLLGGLLAIMGYSTLYLLTAVCSASVAFIIFFLVAESVKTGISRHRLGVQDFVDIRKHHLPFLLFCIFSIFLFLVMAQMSSAYSVYSNNVVGVSLMQVGYLYAINGIMVVVLQIPVSRFIARYRMTSVIAAGALIYAVGYFSVAFCHDFTALALAMVVITLGEIVTSPSTMNLVANLSPEDERGRFMGIFGLFTNTGWSLGPLIGGILLDNFKSDPILLWGGVAAFAVFSALGYLALRGLMDEKMDRVGRRTAKS